MNATKKLPSQLDLNSALVKVGAELRGLNYKSALDGCLYQGKHDVHGEPNGFPFGFLVRHIAAYQAALAFVNGQVGASALRANLRKTRLLLEQVDTELKAYGFPEGDDIAPRAFDLATILS